MATSGVTVNQLTRNQFIEAALRKLNVIADGQTPSSDNYSNGALALNALIGEFRVLGMPLWARKEYTMTLTASTSSYNIGLSQTINTPYPLHILQAWRNDVGNSVKIPVEIVADYDFNMYPTSGTGRPIQLSYTPKVNFGTLKLWPTPDADAVTNCTITLVYHRPMEYTATSTDTMDIPEEWTNAIIYNLAVRLAPEWGIPLPDRQMLASEAKTLLDRVLDFGFEDGSIQFQPYLKQ